MHTSSHHKTCALWSARARKPPTSQADEPADAAARETAFSSWLRARRVAILYGLALEEMGYAVNADGSVAAEAPNAHNRWFSGTGRDDAPPPIAAP